MNSPILVTGGSGFLGSKIVQALVKNGDSVVFTSRSPYNHEGAVNIVLDLLDDDSYIPHTQALEEAECLVHAAAQVSYDQSDVDSAIQEQVINGLEMVKNIVRHARSLKRVIYISSCSAMQLDSSPSLYGLGKLFIEQLLEVIAEQSSIELIILRFPQLYGKDEPHETFITKFIQAILHGEEITLQNKGAVFKDVLYIEDAVGSVLTAQKSARPGIYTITPSQPVYVKEVITEIESLMGKTAQVKHVNVHEEDIKKKSYHYQSNADELGYNIRYTLRDGLTEMTDALRR